MKSFSYQLLALVVTYFDRIQRILTLSVPNPKLESPPPNICSCAERDRFHRILTLSVRFRATKNLKRK